MFSINRVFLVGAGVALMLPISARAQGLANPFLDDSKVQVISLTLASADWADLQKHYLENTYYRASLTWNGITQTLGIRSRGSGSRSPVKPNLTLNFARYDKSQTFLGLPVVTLKANNQDASNLREWFSMKLFRKMGIPAPREAPAQVFVNGQLLGFYYIVEYEDETFLQRNFGENSGYLYEWNSTGDSYDFENLGADPSLYMPYLDLKTSQTAPDARTFANLVQVINQPLGPSFSEADFIQALSQYLDPKQFLTYGATEQALAGADGLIGGLQGLNNFYFYQFQGTTKYYFIPWDKDMTFSIIDRDIMNGISNGPNINLLARRLASIPEYQQVYLNAVTKATTLMGAAGGWADSEITREYGVMHEAAINDPNKQCVGGGGLLTPCGSRQFEDDVQWLHGVLSSRYSFVQSQAVSDGYQPLTGQPQIGAVSTINGVRELSPGALTNLDGTALAPAGQVSALPLPRVLQNETTFVAVEGVRASLISTSDGRIQFQLPLDIPVGTASVVVSNNGALSNTMDVPVQASTPSILGVLHADGSNVSLSRLPAPGEIVSVYATGLGAVSANLPIGAAAPSDPLVLTAATPQMTLGDEPMAILFSGLVPGFIALYQVNAAVPNDLPEDPTYTGCTLTINGQSATWHYPPN